MNDITVCVCVCVCPWSVLHSCKTFVYLILLCKQHKLLPDKMLFCLTHTHTHRRIQRAQSKWSINNDLWDEGGMSEVGCEIFSSHSTFKTDLEVHRFATAAAGYTHTDALYHPGDWSVHVSLSNTGLDHMLPLHYSKCHQFLHKFNHPCLAPCRLCRFGGKMSKLMQETNSHK